MTKTTRWPVFALIVSGKCFGLIFAAFFLTRSAAAQSWTGILASGRAIDWSHAGLPASFPDGETTPNPWTPPTRTQCGPTLTPSGGDDSTQIVAAFNGTGSGFTSCSPPYIVLLGSGTFQLNNWVRLGGQYTRNNITLRGSGPMSTVVSVAGGAGFQSGACCVGGGSGALTSASSNYTQGQTSFLLENVSGTPFVGAVAYFVQCDNGFTNSSLGTPLGSSSCTGSVSDPGTVFSCSDTACAATGNNDPTRQQEVQEVLITAVTNTSGSNWTVTTSPGLYMPDWSYTRGATLKWDNDSAYTAVGIGIEDLTLKGAVTIGNGGYANWMKGVRGIYFSNSGMAATIDCSHCLLANNYFFANNPSSMTAGTSLILQDSHGGDNLFINNIGDFGWWQDDGSDHEAIVVAYNYDRDSADMGEYQATYFTHGVGSSLMLRESNEWGRINDDDTFTSHNLETDFRNNLNCADSPYDLGTTVGGGYQNAPYTRFSNEIGNAMGFGQPSYPTPKCPSYQGAATDGYIWNVNHNNPSTGVQTDSSGLTSASLMRWGNVSNVTQSTDTPANSGIRFVSSEVPTSTVMPSSTYPNAAAYQNSVPANNNLPCSFFLQGFSSTTCTPHYSGGTGLSWWKVCTSWTTFPTTCASSTTPPFPANGPDVLAASGAPNNYANDIPAAVAWKNLPTDTTLQNSYVVSGSSWATNSAGVGTETLTVATMPVTYPEGGFQLVGANPACYPSSGFSYTGRSDGEIIITSSSATSISYALATNPGTSCTGTLKWPDVRQFDERVYGLDSGGAAPNPPTNLTATAQ